MDERSAPKRSAHRPADPRHIARRAESRFERLPSSSRPRCIALHDGSLGDDTADRDSGHGEGIESREQWRFVYLMGCDMAQGYLVGRPMPAHKITALLEVPRLAPLAAA